MREWQSAEEEAADQRASWKLKLEAIALGLCVVLPLAGVLLTALG